MEFRIRRILIKGRGFTLVELMTVMAVIAVLSVAVLPAVSGVSGGLRLTAATQKVVDEIQVARTTAMARNLPVDVWFIQTEDEGRVGFRALRSAVVDSTEATEWVSRVQRLPSGLALAATSEWSNIIGQQVLRDLPQSSQKGVALRIYPSGRAELADDESAAVAPNTPLFVTICNAAAMEKANGTLPANFATVKVNPANAVVVTYRP